MLGAGRRRVGILILTLLFAIALGLSSSPLDPGSVRIAGVSVLWWYAVVMAPTLAVAETMTLLLRSRD